MVDSPDINYASFKYAEKIKFQGRCKGKYAIAFGLNPAMVDLEKIDYTNNRISFFYIMRVIRATTYLIFIQTYNKTILERI